jgi:hypothetical protein
MLVSNVRNMYICLWNVLCIPRFKIHIHIDEPGLFYYIGTSKHPCAIWGPLHPFVGSHNYDDWLMVTCCALCSFVVDEIRRTCTQYISKQLFS